ncbi:hypothetical protein Goshw_021955 [Gossypium schwendimanii]|uniref:RNase H type-1 domain-containing protein n=1 Tax=Gossypium schwendimanii TaxID=34291 RepID=A0A7J9MV91_GOSSC|nr:hypothetical protein [Gossypium schwendimanii]
MPLGIALSQEWYSCLWYRKMLKVRSFHYRLVTSCYDRNLFVFSNGHNYVQKLVDISITWTKSYAKSDSAWPQLNPLVSDTWWSPLEKGWIKHNTDEAMSYISNWASMGGMIRDADARWLCWFSMAVSKETIFRIEARAILEGLPIAWEKGFKQVKLECDNVFLAKALLAGRPASSRSQNKVADQMAKYANNRTPNLLLFKDPPSSIQGVLHADRNASIRG